jgi:hypothetical protein
VGVGVQSRTPTIVWKLIRIFVIKRSHQAINKII